MKTFYGRRESVTTPAPARRNAAARGRTGNQAPLFAKAEIKFD